MFGQLHRSAHNPNPTREKGGCLKFAKNLLEVHKKSALEMAGLPNQHSFEEVSRYHAKL